MPKSRKKTRMAAAATHATLSRLEPASISQVDVARRAYEIYLARGCEQGHDVDDWLQAERDLTKRLSLPSIAGRDSR